MRKLSWKVEWVNCYFETELKHNSKFQLLCFLSFYIQGGKAEHSSTLFHPVTLDRTSQNIYLQKFSSLEPDDCLQFGNKPSAYCLNCLITYQPTSVNRINILHSLKTTLRSIVSIYHVFSCVLNENRFWHLWCLKESSWFH